jgi:hypothetical protein
MPHVTLRYERAKLYEEVWAEAVTTVAKRYGISDVALRKICHKLAVPLPPLGYWAKVAAGQKLPTPPLPRHSGPTEIVRQRYVSDEPVEPDPEHLVVRREYEAKPENRIVVSETLEAPHPLVAATERALRRPKGRDARALPTTDRRALDIAVSEASLPRALRIMDALVKALDARGMPVRIEPDGKRYSYVTLQGEKLAIRLVESTSRTERGPTAEERQYEKKYGYVYLPNKYSYRALGTLKLGAIGSYGSELKNAVADGKHQRVEQRLNDFVVKLEAEAVRRKRHAEHLERQHRFWEEQERIRREREERQRKEVERLKGLEQEAGNWRRAEAIRAYVAAAEAKQIQERRAVDADSKFGLWLVWARHKADWIDPLIQAHCEVLDGEEQDGEDLDGDGLDGEELDGEELDGQEQDA